MGAIPARRRADPSKRDKDYDYIVVYDEDIERDPEGFLWYTDELAGGMALPVAFNDIPAGTKLNEIKAYFIEKLYRNYQGINVNIYSDSLVLFILTPIGRT